MTNKVYRVVKHDGIFYLQRRTRHLWMDIETSKGNRFFGDRHAEYFLKYRAGDLQNEYEKFQEIKNKYSKKFGSVVK